MKTAGNVIVVLRSAWLGHSQRSQAVGVGWGKSWYGRQAVSLPATTVTARPCFPGWPACPCPVPSSILLRPSPKTTASSLPFLPFFSTHVAYIVRRGEKMTGVCLAHACAA